MTIDRFSPLLIATVALVSLLGGGLAVGYVSWVGLEISQFVGGLIFLGTFFTAMSGFNLAGNLFIQYGRCTTSRCTRA